MPDVIDAVIDRLSVSSLELLDEINLNSSRQSRHYSLELEKSLDAIESVYLKRCSLEVSNETELLLSKTRKHKILLDKYTGQFKKLPAAGVDNSNSKKLKAYVQELNRLEKRLSELTNGLDPEEIFIKIRDTHKKIEDFEMKISEIKERLDCFENFPANVTGAQHCVADLKNRIKEKEAALESNLY